MRSSCPRWPPRMNRGGPVALGARRPGTFRLGHTSKCPPCPSGAVLGGRHPRRLCVRDVIRAPWSTHSLACCSAAAAELRGHHRTPSRDIFTVSKKRVLPTGGQAPGARHLWSAARSARARGQSRTVCCWAAGCVHPARCSPARPRCAEPGFPASYGAGRPHRLARPGASRPPPVAPGCSHSRVAALCLTSEGPPDCAPRRLIVFPVIEDASL